MSCKRVQSKRFLGTLWLLLGRAVFSTCSMITRYNLRQRGVRLGFCLGKRCACERFALLGFGSWLGIGKRKRLRQIETTYGFACFSFGA